MIYQSKWSFSPNDLSLNDFSPNDLPVQMIFQSKWYQSKWLQSKWFPSPNDLSPIDPSPINPSLNDSGPFMFPGVIVILHMFVFCRSPVSSRDETLVRRPDGEVEAGVRCHRMRVQDSKAQLPWQLPCHGRPPAGGEIESFWTKLFFCLQNSFLSSIRFCWGMCFVFASLFFWGEYWIIFAVWLWFGIIKILSLT